MGDILGSGFRTNHGKYCLIIELRSEGWEAVVFNPASESGVKDPETFMNADQAKESALTLLASMLDNPDVDSLRRALSWEEYEP